MQTGFLDFLFHHISNRFDATNSQQLSKLQCFPSVKDVSLVCVCAHVRECVCVRACVCVCVCVCVCLWISLSAAHVLCYIPDLQWIAAFLAGSALTKGSTPQTASH